MIWTAAAMRRDNQYEKKLQILYTSERFPIIVKVCQLNTRHNVLEHCREKNMEYFVTENLSNMCTFWVPQRSQNYLFRADDEKPML